MWGYKRILKISWTEKVTNKKVLETIGHQRVLVNEMIKRKMRFAGHIIEDHPGSWQGLRFRVHPGSWYDVKERSGCESIGRAKRYSEDTDSWRVMVANLLIEDGT